MKYPRISLGLVALLFGILGSAFTIADKKPLAGELYWFTHGTQTYVNSFVTPSDEAMRLHALNPSINYLPDNSGSVKDEDGFTNAHLISSGNPSSGHISVTPDGFITNN